MLAGAAADSDGTECHPEIWSLVYIYSSVHTVLSKNRPGNDLYAAMSTSYKRRTPDLLSISAEYAIYVRVGRTTGISPAICFPFSPLFPSLPLPLQLCATFSACKVESRHYIYR